MVRTPEPVETRGESTGSAPGGLSASPPPEKSSDRATAPESDRRADSLLVHEAVESLRNSNDPTKASRLLDEYRKNAPDGALAEEALALSIEAALASGDPKARTLAQQYLARYPQGRFGDLARQALDANL